jgi:protein-export membrane protein SecD
MKLCPACSRVYDDDNLRFCLDDGGQLVDKASGTAAPPTLTLPASQINVPTMKQIFQAASAHGDQVSGAAVNKKRSLLPWLLGAAALLLLGSTIVLGVFILRPKSPLLWHLTLELDQATPDREAAVKQTVKVLESRLDAYGVNNFQVLPQGDGRIVLNLPGMNDPERLKQVIIQGGDLELVRVVSPPSPQPVQTYSTKEEAVASLAGAAIPANRHIVPYVEREEAKADPNLKPTKWVVVEWPAIINGADLRDARAVRSPYGGDDNYQIGFSLNKTGSEKFGAWTAANINNYLGIILNNEVKSIAYIKSQIFDSGEISGRFTKQSAEDLALVLRTGALPAHVTLVSETVDKP